MKEQAPETLACKFIETALRYMIIPLDDQGLSDDYDVERFTKNLADSSCVKDFDPILEALPITPFFRNYLLYDIHLNQAKGYTSEEELLDNIDHRLGISIEKNRFGICDPEIGLDLENDFFKKEAERTLKIREAYNVPSPVDWREWQQEINRRFIEGVRY